MAVTPLRVVPAFVSKRVQLGRRYELIEPLPMSQLDDVEAVDNELSDMYYGSEDSMGV